MDENERVEYRGYVIEPVQDDWTESPRDSCDNLGTMVYGGNRYVLGDVKFEQALDEPPWTVPGPSTHRTPEDWEAWAEASGLIYLRTYAYIHGMTAMSTRSFIGRAQHAEWDSGQAGWIFVSRAKAREWFGWDRITEKRRKKVEECLDQEVETFSAYMEGNVWGYLILDPENPHEPLDSCYGFYGDSEEPIDYARGEIDAWIKVKEEGNCLLGMD